MGMIVPQPAGSRPLGAAPTFVAIDFETERKLWLAHPVRIAFVCRSACHLWRYSRSDPAIPLPQAIQLKKYQAS